METTSLVDNRLTKKKDFADVVKDVKPVTGFLLSATFKSDRMTSQNTPWLPRQFKWLDHQHFSVQCRIHGGELMTI